MISWVVGRGLVGRAVDLELSHRGPCWRPAWSFRWRDADLVEQLGEAVAAFTAAAGGEPWRVAWCAGAGVVATDPADLERDAAALAGFLAALARHRPQLNDDGSVLLASSAGGVYAGSGSPPFDERSTPRPLSAYGRTKLDQEAMVGGWAGEQGVRALVARLANLYGPGQDLSKPQGLLSQLALGTLTRRAVLVYVGLDTLRSYLYVADAAAICAEGLDRLAATTEPGTAVTKVVANPVGTTVAAVLAEVQRVTHLRPRVAFGTTPQTALQVRDLRLRSVVWPELDDRVLTTLPAGLHAVVGDLRGRLARAELRLGVPA